MEFLYECINKKEVVEDGVLNDFHYNKVSKKVEYLKKFKGDLKHDP